MNDLKILRLKIDEVDSKISKLLKERMDIVIEIKKLKKTQHKTVKDKVREKEIINKFENEYEKKVFKKIIEESRKLQNKD